MTVSVYYTPRTDFLIPEYTIQQIKVIEPPFVELSCCNGAFAVTALKVCNTLSVHLKSADTVGGFQRRVTCELFARAYE
jgi:hypothetical protein